VNPCVTLNAAWYEAQIEFLRFGVAGFDPAPECAFNVVQPDLFNPLFEGLQVRR
jgi:hypothetical protein